MTTTITLPDKLRPLAEFAAGTIPAVRGGTYAVFLLIDGLHPQMIRGDIRSSVVAQRLACDTVAMRRTEEVYVIRRTPTMVMVNSRRLDRPDHLLGVLETTVAVAYLPCKAGGDAAWDHVRNFFPDRLDKAGEHMKNVYAAVRLAHHMPADATIDDVIGATLEHPLPARVYFDAYVQHMFTPVGK
jgi:hypothetical protein